MGEAKVPPLGFFGQPLQTGMSSVSTGPGLSSGIYAQGSNGESVTGRTAERRMARQWTADGPIPR